MNKAKFTLFLISFLSMALLVQAKELSQKDYAALFDKVSKINKFDIGPQCAFASPQDTQEAEAMVDDEDYKLSYNQFFAKLKTNGLLEPKLFHNPENPEPDHEERAINSIISWTEHYQKNNLIYSSEKCFLSDKEIFSIFYYTGEGFRILNTAIRNKDTDLIDRLAVLGKHLGMGLQKLKPYNGYVKRIRKLDVTNKKKLAEFNEEHAEGHIITQTAYTSTTIGALTFQGNIEYILKTHKNCYYIADFSLVEQKINGYSHLEEEEVLCLPKTQFKVLYHKIEGDNHKIIMEEVIE